jgi:hypothetical protein
MVQSLGQYFYFSTCGSRVHFSLTICSPFIIYNSNSLTHAKYEIQHVCQESPGAYISLKLIDSLLFPTINSSAFDKLFFSEFAVIF